MRESGAVYGPLVKAVFTVSGQACFLTCTVDPPKINGPASFYGSAILLGFGQREFLTGEVNGAGEDNGVASGVGPCARFDGLHTPGNSGRGEDEYRDLVGSSGVTVATSGDVAVPLETRQTPATFGWCCGARSGDLRKGEMGQRYSAQR